MKNFSFKWFLTTPGILTGLGVLLIIISIIIFIASIKGSKKNKEDDGGGRDYDGRSRRTA